jgi:hypothetical protein
VLLKNALHGFQIKLGGQEIYMHRNMDPEVKEQDSRSKRPANPNSESIYPEQRGWDSDAKEPWYR